MKLSIITPVFNEKKRVGEYLEMLSKQTVPPEIVIVDGHSKDGTIDVVKKYQKKMKNLKLFFETGEFKSPANARNIGLEKAKGEFVFVADVDAIFENKFTEKIEKEIEKTKANVIRFNFKPLKPRFNSSIEKAYYYRDIARCLKKQKFHLLKKKLHPKYNPSLGYGEDKILWREISRIISENKAYHSKEVLCICVIGPKNLKEVWNRYKWYGRTGMLYYHKSKDKIHLTKMALAVLSIPFIFIALIPMIRGLIYSLRIIKEYPQGMIIIPLLEALAFPAMAVGFWKYILNKKNKHRGH